MTEKKTPRIILPIDSPLLKEVDDFRFKNRHASRAAAIRCLISLGLAAAQRRQKETAE